MADQEYIRLTRSSRQSKVTALWTASSALWLGKDHILLLESTGYSETYRRFYFKDIQALILRKTNTWIIRASVLAGVALLFALIALAVREVIEALIVLGTVSFLFALIAVLDALAGPTSTCVLQTAVQTEELPSLNRVRRARRVLERLRPMITAAQGTLSPEEVLARLQTQAASAQKAASEPEIEGVNIPPRIL